MSTSAACSLLAGTPAIAAGPHFTIGEPEGFADLSDEQTVVLDVYFGGLRVGAATVTAAPGAVTLIDPGGVVALLPALKDTAPVLQELSSPEIPSNAALVCGTTTDQARCGRLEPDIAGVIFDREHFRLDVFVNPRFLAAGNAPRELYVPEPAQALSLVNAIGAVVSGQLGTRRDTYFTLQDNVLVGSGARRFRAELSYGDGGLEADAVALELDRPELRFSVGALWAPGSDLVTRRQILGVGVASQIDTRVDRESLLGAPLIVFLDRRSRVDVLRDGRLVHSGTYEAGNQQIDTAALPDGAYDITIRIEQANGVACEEHRFFSKSRRVPSLGRTDFFAFGGLTIGRDNPASGNSDPEPYLTSGVARRLSEHWALEGAVQLSAQLAAFQAGTTLLLRPAQVHAAAVAQTDGTLGALVQIASSGNSRLSFNLDLRHFDATHEHGIGGAEPTGGEPASSHGGIGRYTQASGIVSYSMANLRILATGYFRKEEATARYSIGPALEWDLLRRGPVQLGLRTDLTLTEHGRAGFAGLSLRFVGRRASVAAVAGVHRSGVADDPLGNGAVVGVSGGWNTDVGNAQLALTGGYEHQPKQDALSVSGDLRHRAGALTADLTRVVAEHSTTDQFSLGLHSTLVAGQGFARLAGRVTTQSMIVAKVDGARSADRFEILVDDQVAGILNGSGSTSLALPSYRTYHVRVRPVGASLLSYDSTARVVGLYPGTVARLLWSAAPVVIRFGRLVAPDGIPMANATITGPSIWTETDGEGYFQLEAPEGAELTVSTHDGQSFPLFLPRTAHPSADIVRLGTVECCGNPSVRLGARLPGTTLAMEKDR